MDPSNIVPVLAAVKSRQTRPAHHPSPSKDQDGPFAGMAVLLAGAVRAILFTLKRRAVLGFVRKRAFLALGKRTTRTAVIATTDEAASVAPLGKVGGILKNVTLGVSVFFTYEYVVDHHFLGSGENEAAADSTKGGDGVDLNIEDHEEMKPLFAHFCAGACSGLAQTTVLTTWEILGTIPRTWNSLTKPVWLQNITFDNRFLARRTVHHAIGYASLFGCFELFRRQLLQRFHDHLASGSEWVPIVFDELERHNLIRRQSGDRNLYDVTPVTLTAAFLAGGFAGQVHHTVSHYTSHWKLQALEPSQSNPKMTSPMSSWRQLSMANVKTWVGKEFQSMPPPPTIRSTMGAFGPAALCFVAFQYGGELAARMVEEDRASRPFPVLCKPS